MSSPPRPVPRRVYGKSKAQQLVPIDPDSRSTTTPTTSTTTTTSILHAEPPSLLQFGKHADWRRKLKESDLPSDDDDLDEDEDEDDERTDRPRPDTLGAGDEDAKARALRIIRAKKESENLKTERERLVRLAQQEEGDEGEEREAPSSQNNRGGTGAAGGVGQRSRRRYGFGYRYGLGQEDRNDDEDEEDSDDKGKEDDSDGGAEQDQADEAVSSSLPPLTSSLPVAPISERNAVPSLSTSLQPNNLLSTPPRSVTRLGPSRDDAHDVLVNIDPMMLFPSSTLTPLSGSSDQRISPDPRKSSSAGSSSAGILRRDHHSPLGDDDVDMEETYAPIRAGVRRKKRGKIIGLSSMGDDDDDDDDDEDDDARDHSVGDQTITPTRDHARAGHSRPDRRGTSSRTGSVMIDEVADSSDILGSFSTPQKTARVKSMLIATSGISPTSPTRRPGSGKIKGMMDKDEHGDRDVDMDEDEDEEDGMGSPSVRASRKRASAGRLGLSELESEDEASARVAKAPKIRPLSKKQRIEMEREQAKIRASKPIRLAPAARARSSHTGATGGGLGMTDFVRQTQLAWVPARGTTVLGSGKETRPMSQYLLPGVEARTSHVAPIVPGGMQEEEEIGKFSSGGNRNPGGSTRGPGSSPTGKGKGKLRLRELNAKTLTDDKVRAGMHVDLEDDEEDLPELEDVIAKKQREQLIARKREELARQKAIAYKKMQEELLRDRNRPDEDDLIIDGAPDSVKKPIRPTRRHNAASARGIFDHAREARHGKGLDAGQRLAALAGIATNKHPDTMTESLVVHAGRDYDHANQKRAGVVPFGLDKRKVEIIDKVRFDAELIRRQRLFNAKERQRKEEESGVKARRLEAKRPLELDDLIRRGGWDEPDDQADSEEDPEDGEYKPKRGSDVEIDAEAGQLGSEDERSIVYSGEEDDAQEPIVHATPPPPETEVDIDEEVEFNLPRRSRPRKSIVHTVRDSDDEETTPKPLSKASFTPPPRSTPILADAMTTDVAGFGGFGTFGEDDGAALGGGFSQFFGATQAGDSQPDAFGGFDVLRHDDADAVLATQIHLPDPTISATAKRRNEELLEGEMMLEPETLEVEKGPLKQYFNEQGLLTQTRPAGRAPLKKADTSTSLQSEGASEHLSIQSMPLSATYRSPPRTDDADHSMSSAAKDEFATLRRLKHRRPSSSLSEPDDDDLPRPSSEAHLLLDSDGLTLTEIASDPAPVAQPRPRNAFDVLKAAPRSQLKLDPKSIAERKARFVEGEAEESDEENGWGGGTRQDDIEEDEDPNAILEELVDDAEKTVEELEREEQQRQQKYREIAEQDDEKHRKVAEDLTRGIYRTGKNGKMNDIEFSDDEDEDRKIRRSKKRRRERELKGVDRESAFHHVHQEIVASSDEEFGDIEDDQRVFDLPLPGPPSKLLAKPVYQPSTSPAGDEIVPQKTISAKARELAIENKRSVDLVCQNSGSDTEGSDDERSSFVVTRNDSQSLAPRPSMISRDSSKYARHLNEESQRSTDTRKIGGSSSVSGVTNRKPAVRSAFGASLVSKTSKALPPVRTQSRSLGRVMDKSGHFDPN